MVTSSEGSYSYESQSQHWEFGDDDFLDADDSQVEDNRQLFPPHGDSSVAESPRTVQDAHQLVTNDDRLTESDPRLQDGNSGDEGRARGSGGRARQDVGVDDVTEPTMRPRTEPRVDHADDGDSDNGAGDGLEPRAIQERHTAADDADDDDDNVRQHLTVIHLNGYQYTRARQSRVRIAYRCSFYRRTACKGKVHFDIRTATYTNSVAHTCRATVTAPAVAVNVSTRIEEETDRLATTNQGMTAHQI